MSYTIRLTERQARAISHACETCARLGLLQFDMAADFVGKGYAEEKYCDIRDEFEKVRDNVRSIGIVPVKMEEHNILWDIYQVLRHRLSWDDLKRENKTRPVGSVLYDDPFKTSNEPLLKIERINQLNIRTKKEHA